MFNSKVLVVLILTIFAMKAQAAPQVVESGKSRNKRFELYLNSTFSSQSSLTRQQSTSRPNQWQWLQ